jgi:hypothetical protein
MKSSRASVTPPHRVATVLCVTAGKGIPCKHGRDKRKLPGYGDVAHDDFSPRGSGKTVNRIIGRRFGVHHGRSITATIISGNISAAA